MKYRGAQGRILTLILWVSAACLSSSTAFAVDEVAAKELLKRNDCTKCHAVDKSKKGPSYKKVAAKYKGKSRAEAEKNLLDNVTKEPMVELDDGTKEKHKVIDTQDPKELKNLFDYVLSR